MMNRLHSLKALRSKRGFTLAETVVTTAVFGVVSAITMNFLLTSVNFSSYTQGKALISRDIRTFTTTLTQSANFANYFQIYESFTERERRDQGSSGDFAVFVFVDEADSSLTEKIIGYYRHASTTESGPVRRFELNFSPSSALPVEQLLPGTGTAGSHQKVIELSNGLSDGQLFYNFFNRSITVQGEILHQGTTVRNATNTYNFTVSPRG